jgi:hypothetical protein
MGGNLMKKLLIVAAMAAGALALPGLANAADVTGAWKVAVTFGDMTFHTNCDFKQAAAALSGTCISADPAPDGAPAPKPAVVTGSVDGSNVKFGYDIMLGDMPLHLDYVGVLDASGAAMKGNIGAGDMQIPFTAAKG